MNMNKKIDENTVRKHYAELTNLLISRKLTITTMESCTAGQLASLITDTEGSSAVLKGAFVTYCNEAKIMQGVSEKVLNKYSVYSGQTAKEMAKACKKAYSADIGIGVTGSFGNIDPANPESSVPGTVYFAIDVEGEKCKSFKRTLPVLPTRLQYKLAIADIIFKEIMKMI